jgi:hypothetical protein
MFTPLKNLLVPSSRTRFSPFELAVMLTRFVIALNDAVARAPDVLILTITSLRLSDRTLIRMETRLM